MINKRFILTVFLLLGFSRLIGQSLLQTKEGSDKEKPNILFILIDDLGWNTLSSYGDSFVKTPNIDRLAEQGMTFTQAYSAPMCNPSRARLITGEYGVCTGIMAQGAGSPRHALLKAPEIKHKVKEDNYTMANMLQDVGYTTMVSGKWNLGGGYKVAGVKEKQGGDYFKPYGFDYIGDGREKDWNKIDKTKGTPAIIDDFFQFTDSRIDNQPFFAYLAFFAIHTPLDAPDSLVDVFVNKGFSKSTARFGDASEKPTANYLAMIKYLDDAIGRLLKGLEKRGLENNTIVVFTSDNGAMNRVWNNDPLRGAKGLLYEGGVRIPLLVRWPGKVKRGSQTDTPVDMVDWYPTFMEIARGSIPLNKKLSGVSIVPLLMQSGKLDRKALYQHRPVYNLDYGQTPASSIRLGDYKLIHYYGDYLDTRGYLPPRHGQFGKLIKGVKDELFNIRKDPGENVDIHLKYPAKTKELLDSLNAWLRITKAPMPTDNSRKNIKNGIIKRGR